MVNAYLRKITIIFLSQSPVIVSFPTDNHSTAVSEGTPTTSGLFSNLWTSNIYLMEQMAANVSYQWLSDKTNIQIYAAFLRN